ncbi:MAG TPA: SMI1/KNR4 family protein [Polyangiales bacterium]|nr:SMI1/KNR4 family protein [Polyangiales bacterium]
MNSRFPKPSASEVASFRAEAPTNIPEEYVEYVEAHGAVQIDIESIGSGLVWFWSLPEVMELNRGYRFQEFAPGLFGFGSDGAGELYAFDLRDPANVTVGQVPSIPLQIDRYRIIANSFREFAGMLEFGSPVPPPPHDETHAD